MTMWHEYLLQQRAQLLGQDQSGGTVFDTDAGPAPASFVAPLTDLGQMAFGGDDAANFLHNQLTNDVEHLAPAQARLAGYCSPKGRLLATFLMWKSADAVILQLPRDIQASVQKRLQMFVLRAKVKITDQSDSVVALGLAGPDTAAALARWFDALPAVPYAKVDAAAGTLIRLSDADGIPRYQWMTNPETAIGAWPQLIRTLQPVGTALWRLTDIHAAIPHITPATQDKFVPQMINFEVVGGVNFKKGCYPGQEIVARSQYLGKLKRRMMPATVAAETASAGMEVFSSVDPEQPCGMIVNAERNTQNGIDCLVEIKTAAIDAGTIHLGSAGGPALAFRSLPYPLPDAA